MRVAKKIIVFLDNLSFTSKIAIVFAIFCILQIAIMSIIFFQQNIDTLRNNTAAQLLNVVKTKNEIVDMRLKSIGESIALFTFDSKLFEIFDSYEKYSKIDRLSIPSEMQTLFFRYFGDSPDIYSVNLLSSKFSISNRPYHFEYSDFLKSPILYYPENDRNYFQYWIPNFNIRAFTEEVNPIGDVRYGFATAKRLNLTTLFKTSFITLSSIEERPYVLIVFDKDFFNKYYLNATSFHDSRYTVISQDGTIVASNLYPIENKSLPTWFTIAKKEKVGMRYVTINGVETLVCFSTSNETGWITAITTPARSLTLNASSTQRQLIILSLVLTVIMLMIYFQSARLLAKPIKRLVKSAHNIEEINKPTSNELKILSYAFENVDQKLKNLMNENYMIKLNEKEAKIAILNAQIKPHFIYNTLNTINWMAVERNETNISKMVVSLAEILQYTFRDYEIIVHFSEEINWLKQYLFIMSNRFEGKFVVNYDVDPVLFNCFVPKLLLQPLVENSIIHGFHHINSGGMITISGWIEGDDLFLSVIDNGCGMTEEKISSILHRTGPSIGCRNVDNKLRLIYGDEYGIEISSIEHRGTTITAKMPVRYEK